MQQPQLHAEQQQINKIFVEWLCVRDQSHATWRGLAMTLSQATCV